MDKTRVQVSIVHPRATRVVGRLNSDNLNVGML